MFWKIGVMRGLLVIVMTLGFMSVVTADTEIDASTFVNDNAFCGDAQHVIPAGERLTIDGGLGTRFVCGLEIGEGATFAIKGGAILDIDTFDINSGSNNNVTFKIEKSSIFTGDELNIGGGGDNHSFICEESILVQITGMDFGIDAGGNGATAILDECTLATIDGGVTISASSIEIEDSNITAADTVEGRVTIYASSIEIEESNITAAAGIEISVGGPEDTVEIEDSVFMSGMDIVINGAKLESEDNVYYARSVPNAPVNPSDVVVTAGDCESEDDIVVGIGVTDICL